MPCRMCTFPAIQKSASQDRTQPALLRLCAHTIVCTLCAACTACRYVFDNVMILPEYLVEFQYDLAPYSVKLARAQVRAASTQLSAVPCTDSEDGTHPLCSCW
jgi:hypothetical protein